MADTTQCWVDKGNKTDMAPAITNLTVQGETAHKNHTRKICHNKLHLTLLLEKSWGALREN